MPLAPGQIVAGKYRVLAKLSEGGFGDVYKVEHVHFGDIRALKTMKAIPNVELSILMNAFVAEAVILRNCRHPNIVEVHDIETAPDGTPMIVMDFVEGQSLRAVLNASTSPFAPDRAVNIVVAACNALAVAHEKGVIHRDIKPANILLHGDDVKLIDFGLAKVREDATFRATGGITAPAGQVMGSPLYVSPEQARGLRGNELDGRSDLYSLALVLYEMLTLRLPFEGEEPAVAFQRLFVEPVPPATHNPSLSAKICDVIMKALCRDRDQRFATVSEFKLNLQTALDEVDGEDVDIFEFWNLPDFSIAAGGRSSRGDVVSTGFPLNSDSTETSLNRRTLVISDSFGRRNFHWTRQRASSIRSSAEIEKYPDPSSTYFRVDWMGSGHFFVFDHGQMVPLGDAFRDYWLEDFETDDNYFDNHEAFKRANYGAICGQQFSTYRTPGALICLVSPDRSFLGIETQLETIFRSNSSLQEMAARIAAAPLSLDSTSVVLFRIPEP